METIHQYRHIIDKEVKDVFIKSIKETIKKSNIKNIGFIGIIGSLKEEYSHDIDVLIFPAKKAKIGEAIVSVSKFYEALERILRRHHERFYPVVAPKKIYAGNDLLYCWVAGRRGWPDSNTLIIFSRL